jgi:hypothetical protein
MKLPESNFTTSKNKLTDTEIETYLHDIAREFNSNKMKIVAERFSELHKIKKQLDERLVNDWK